GVVALLPQAQVVAIGVPRLHALDVETRWEVWPTVAQHQLHRRGGRDRGERRRSVRLVWEREDWRIDRWEAAAGPTPALASNSVVSSVDEVARVLAWPVDGGS
ncbi:MAG: hypothetical protein ACT452_15665, partial [Microthrixaceae bacterium]